MKSRMINTMKLHPVSTVLLIFYITVSILFGNMSLFLMGFLAASAAYVLELLFCVTGMIRTGRSCAGRSGSSGMRKRQQQGRSA